MQTKPKTTTLDEFVDDHFGKRGAHKREKFENVLKHSNSVQCYKQHG